jgi:hypothetical protein
MLRRTLPGIWTGLLAVAGGCARAPATPRGSEPPGVQRVVDGPHAELTIGGEDAANGIFDPAIAYDAAGTGWLTYSAVFGGRHPFGPYIETRLARSTDQGRSWTRVATINRAFDDTIVTERGERLAGNWNYEVSSIAHDPSDAARPWRLVAHRLFAPVTTGTNDPRYSWIIARSADRPDGEWSPEVAILESGLTPFPPFRGRSRQRVNDLAPVLSGIVAYSEPGLVAVGGTLFLSLVAMAPDGPERVILLVSRDHGTRWSYGGTLLARDDAQRFGFDMFDGSSLARDAGGGLLLFVAPSRRVGRNVVHFGTFVIDVADPATARVARDGSGRPLVRLYLRPDSVLWSGNGAGQATWDHRNATGILMPQMQLSTMPRIFRVFATGSRP